MAKNKIQVNDFTTEELKEELQSAVSNFKKLKFDHVTTGLENPLKLVEVRRDIARIKTELRKRELAEASEEAIANRSKTRARRRREKVSSSIRRRKVRAKKQH